MNDMDVIRITEDPVTQFRLVDGQPVFPEELLSPDKPLVAFEYLSGCPLDLQDELATDLRLEATKDPTQDYQIGTLETQVLIDGKSRSVTVYKALSRYREQVESTVSEAQAQLAEKLETNEPNPAEVAAYQAQLKAFNRYVWHTVH